MAAGVLVLPAFALAEVLSVPAFAFIWEIFMPR